MDDDLSEVTHEYALKGLTVPALRASRFVESRGRARVCVDGGRTASIVRRHLIVPSKEWNSQCCRWN